MKALIDEAKSPALWATLGTAIPLIGQLFTSTGNATLAAAGGALVAIYSIAVQLKNAFLAMPPPGATSSGAQHNAALSQVSASLASASAATATAAATLPAAVRAAAQAMDSLHGVAGDVARLVERAEAAPAPTTLPPFKAGNPPGV